MMRLCRRPLCVLLLLMGVAVSARAFESARDQANGTLHSAAWRFQIWGRSLSGLAGWIREADGRWRLELVLGDDTSEHVDAPMLLLDQIGEGWTVVSVDGLSTYIQPWRDKSEPIPDADARLVEALLAVAESGSAAKSALTARGARVVGSDRTRRYPRLPWSGLAPESDTIVVDWSMSADTKLRNALESRGRGRGGSGETWRLDVADTRAR
jgi:hypothetical protein